MAYQVRTTKSYGSRLSDSFKGIISGFIMFIAGTVLLFWNEGNFIKTKESIQEAEKVVVRVDDVSSVNPELNGKLIHASSFADTEDVLADEMFGVRERAISISRKVEYYQYVEKKEEEKKDRTGGGEETIITYTYEKQWVKEPVNSAEFHDPSYESSNTVLKRIDASTIYAKNVSFGGYKLPPSMISSISGSEPAEAKITPEEMMHVKGNEVYYGESTSAPKIGDVRVTLTKIMPTDISIIGKVVNNTFEQYVAKNGKNFSRVAMGTVSAENMFSDAHSENKMLTWLFRFIGILLVVFGLKSMFSILPALFKVLPFLGNIVDAGVGLVCTVFGGAWSILIIAISWLFYRPLIGVPLLLISILGIWYLKKKAKEKKSD